EMGRTFDIQTYTFPGGGGGGEDSSVPSQPGGLTASAPSGSQVNLSWTASTDNVGVTGYRVYRDGPLLTATGSVPSCTDSTVVARTTQTYEVSAVDAAGNESAKSTSVTVTTPLTFSFTAVEDATVDASQPSVNLGSATRVTVDNSPVNDALLKFTVNTGGCAISSAKLQLTVGGT